MYSYHYYNGVSERLQSIMPMAHWSPEKAHTEEYLAVAPGMARSNAPLRDRYVPGGQMWVTESGDAAEPIREGAHVYAHSRHDGKPGKAYLVINNSMTETTTVELPGKAEIYQLTAETPRASVMQCNGKALTLGESYALPAMDPVAAEGTLTLPALSCTFIVTEG